MSMNNFTLGLFLGVSLLANNTNVSAQVNAADSVMNHAKGNKLSLGGYGEAAYSRNFYSDNGNRYTTPGLYKKTPVTEDLIFHMQ